MSRKRSVTFERKAFRTSRLAEFASIPELEKATGQPVENWVLVVVKELADNATDEAEEAGVAPTVEITVEADAITVADQGRGVKPALVKALIDYSTKISSRAAVVAPSRGQQGNALQSIIAMGHALDPKADAAVVIESQGVAHTIRFTVDPVRQTPVPQRDTAPSAVKIGTRVTVRWPDSPRSSIARVEDSFFSLAEAYGWLNPHLTLSVDWRADSQRVWEWLATDPDWSKWRPSQPSSAHWYDIERLSQHMAAEIAHAEDSRKPCVTVREFIRQFRGLSSTAKINAVCIELGVAERETLAEYYSTALSAARLLAAMRNLSNPPKPRDLGVIGEAHLRNRFLDNGCDPNSVQYRKREIELGGVPYMIEVAFGYRPDSAYGRDVIEGFNFAPAIGGSPFQLEARLAGFDVDEDDPVTMFAHLTSPRLSFIDKGKAKLALPATVAGEIIGLVRLVTKAWTKQKTAEIRDTQARLRRHDAMTRRDKPATTKDAFYAAMPAAYMVASADNTLPAGSRQVMYAARRSVLEATEKETLDDKYFTQTLLPNYMAEHPEETADWDVVFDDRGHFREPHTDHEIGLGTIAVRNYIAKVHGPKVKPAGIDPASIDTLGPAGRYGSVLFCEKEGFGPIIDAAGIPEEFDIAPMSTKGMSVTAARRLIDHLCGRLGLKLYVMHDFDVSGFSILKTLTTSNRRYTFRHKVEFVDLGLTLADVRRLSLEDEPVDVGDDENGAIARRLRINGALPAEVDFLLSGRRVELNVMPSDVFVQFVRDKLTAHRVAKVVPAPQMLADTYAAFKRSAMARSAVEAELARLNAVAIDVPADLDAQVRAYLAEHPTATWDDAVKAIMERSGKK